MDVAAAGTLAALVLDPVGRVDLLVEDLDVFAGRDVFDSAGEDRCEVGEAAQFRVAVADLLREILGAVGERLDALCLVCVGVVGGEVLVPRERPLPLAVRLDQTVELVRQFLMFFARVSSSMARPRDVAFRSPRTLSSWT